MKKILMSLVFCFCLQNLNAQVPLTIQNAKQYQFTSKVNNTTYILGVSVPEDYTSTKKYPVFYILDGFYTSEIAHGAHRTLEFFKEMEDAIVVTIAGTEKTKNEWFINRWGDLTFTKDLKNDTFAAKQWNLSMSSLKSRNGVKFLEVLKAEIIPTIEKNYSTNGKRGIAGHSLGGLFVANLMFNSGDLFEKFGINSPSLKIWNNNDIRIVEKAFSEKHTELNAKVILTFGGLESKKNIEDLREFEALLKSHYKGIETSLVVFDSETHASVTSAMISRNMLYLYSNKLEK